MPSYEQISPLRHGYNAFFATVSTIRSRLRNGPLLPSWTFKLEWAISIVRRDWEDLWHFPAPALRTHLERLPPNGKVLAQVEMQSVTVNGVPGMWFTPRSGTSDAVLYYLHGGGYISGSFKTHGELIARLALTSGARTLAIEYRLAPEHTYPAQLDDALAGYRWLLAQGIDPRRIVIAGESAGGNLTLALLIALRNAGEPLPAAAIPISPWVDMESKSASMVKNAPYDYGSREMLLFMARSFCGDIDHKDPRVSLLYADLSGLPPLLLQVGGAERLYDEGADFAERARKAGVEAVFDVLHEMPHASPMLAEYAPAGLLAVERAGRFVRERTGTK